VIGLPEDAVRGALDRVRLARPCVVSATVELTEPGAIAPWPTRTEPAAGTAGVSSGPSAGSAPIAVAVAATTAEIDETRRQARPRLTHVDAMRPVKQLGVVSTHALQYFAPAGSIGVGAGLMLTHVTRFAFMFISSAMLVYAYPYVRRGGWRTFWRRRLLAVAVPYMAWTLIYFALGVEQAGRVGSIASDGEHLGSLLLTGYDQLYFLVLLLQFYLIYPAFLWLIRRTERHHWWLLAVSLALEVAAFWLVHDQVVPGWMLGKGATRELWNYQLFVVAGAVTAWHYQAVHAWLSRHWRGLLAASAMAVAIGEGWYLLSAYGVPGFRAGDPSDPFQPTEIPLYLGLIAVVYLLGLLMTREGRPRWLRSLVQAGADYSYGIYLSQVLFLTLLGTLGWASLDRYLPWEVVTAGGVAVVFVAAGLLTAVMARLPGARATAGIPRRPWRTTNGGSHGGR
jgi:peptidoglycan/LPS O-acetylase OafA/YrhL